MSEPTREEVEAFLTALRYGMKVSHKPEFLIALAEGYYKHLETETAHDANERWTPCDHRYEIDFDDGKTEVSTCGYCRRVKVVFK